MKEALLMRGTKGTVKTSKIVLGDEDASKGFDERVLMSLVMDVSQLNKSVERVKVQVFTLAKEKGIRVPSASAED